LTSGDEIRRVLRTGRRSRREHLDILWATSDRPAPRLGLLVPRLGQTAVARNRLRRRLKELWRKELQHSVSAVDVLFRARKESYEASMAQLRADLLGWLELAR
jgi:ribonuclease P protein component